METRPNLIVRALIKEITPQNKFFGVVILDPSLADVSVRVEVRVDGGLISSGFADILHNGSTGHCRKKFRVEAPHWITTKIVKSTRFLLLVFVAEKIVAAKLHKDFSDNRRQEACEALSVVSEVEVGLVSLDESAIMGKDGFFFLNKGSNYLSALYGKEDLNISDRWIDLLSKRLSYFETFSCQYQQIFIPEKNTVLNSFLPYESPSITPVYQNLKDKIKLNVTLNESTLFYDDLLCGNDIKMVYRKKDTHFTTYGAEILLAAILKQIYLNDQVLYSLGPSMQVNVDSDLGSKFGASFKYDQLDVFREMNVNGIVMHPQLLSEKIPAQGNQGIVRVYHNDKAPFDQKMIGFVNSFFWQGLNSYGVSWWLSRLFREYHFVWNPEVDFDYIEQNNPDIVIGLAIERFMHRVPNK